MRTPYHTGSLANTGRAGEASSMLEHPSRVIVRLPRTPIFRYVIPIMARTATLTRKTAETDITVSLNLDGSGLGAISTGVGFFDHMLTALCRHALIDMDIKATGDTHIDFHHTVEDVGIVIGQALLKALGEKRGIGRFGHATIPMDEALVEASIDISGRAYTGWDVRFNAPKVGEMDTELFEEFFRALASNALIALHIRQLAGTNTHHVAEACFKATARALRQAIEPDTRLGSAIPSTKGAL